MPRKKEKKVRIRVGRVARPRAVGSGKKASSKQIVNIYVTPSGAVSYANPIRGSSVLESPMPIPQQPIQPFQPIFPQQQFQQQQQPQYPFAVGVEPTSPRQEAIPISPSQEFLERVNLQREIEKQRKFEESQIPEPLLSSRSKPYIEKKREQFERQKKEIIGLTKK